MKFLCNDASRMLGKNLAPGGLETFSGIHVHVRPRGTFVLDSCLSNDSL